jgi:hypothetical protein
LSIPVANVQTFFKQANKLSVFFYFTVILFIQGVFKKKHQTLAESSRKAVVSKIGNGVHFLAKIFFARKRVVFCPNIIKY